MGDWKDLNEYRKCEDETVQQARNKEEIDRLRANEGSLCEKIRALTDENKRLRANQIPGRCGECGNKKIGKNITGQYEYCGLGNIYTETGFCQEWKPKE